MTFFSVFSLGDSTSIEVNIRVRISPRLKGIFSIHHQNQEVLLHTHSDDADKTAEVCGSVCSVLGLSPLCVWHFIKTFFRQMHPLQTTVQKMWDRSERIRSFYNASDYSWKIRAAETTGGFQSLLLFLFSFCKQQIVIRNWNGACSGDLKQIPLVKMSCRVFFFFYCPTVPVHEAIQHSIHRSRWQTQANKHHINLSLWWERK